MDIEQLIHGGELKRRCGQEVRCKCLTCGDSFSSEDWQSNGSCQTCGGDTYSTSCGLCSGVFDAIPIGKTHICKSVEQFEKTGLVAFKKISSHKDEAKLPAFPPKPIEHHHSDHPEPIKDKPSPKPRREDSPDERPRIVDSPDEDRDLDPLYAQAVEIVVKSGRASISLVQRTLRIGYNRGSRLVEMMEHRGIVSPMQSNGNREVLVGLDGKPIRHEDAEEKRKEIEEDEAPKKDAEKDESEKSESFKFGEFVRTTKKILFVASLIAGFFIGVKFWFALIFIAIILYRYQTDDRDGLWTRSWHSLYGGVCLSGLIFAGIWTYGYFHSDSKSGEIALTKNVKTVEPSQAIAENPATRNTQQADAKQELIRDTPQPVTWSNDSFPGSAPVTRETPPIAVQESTNRSNSDRIPVAGSTVGQANENVSGARGWLGLDAQPLTTERTSSINPGSAPRGMFINDVVRGGPADKAGVVAGDLLVAVDNKAVDTNDATRDVVSNIPVGRVVPIKIIRDGREMSLLLTMEQRP